MRIVCIADTQGYCQQIKPEMLPEGDMLLVAGDLAGGGTLKELGSFNNWLGTLPYKYKVIVGGNHDQGLREVDGHTFFTNATYLQDELVEIEDLKIYGSPLNDMNELRHSNDWAFCDPRYIANATAAIPKGLDILITHGPPLMTLDKLSDGRHVGSDYLAEAVFDAKPRYHVFGHIHESYGIHKTKGSRTVFINAALCNERNELFYPKNYKMLRVEPTLIHTPRVIEL